MSNEPRGRLDHAIDRAVRGMMQVDPVPGLRIRVAERLHERPRRRTLSLSFAASALAMIAIASFLLFRATDVNRAIHSTDPVAPASQSTVLNPPAAAGSPAPTIQTPSPAAAQDSRITNGERPPALPRPNVIFTGPRDRVSAASVRDDVPRKSDDAPSLESTPMPEAVVPISPIVIAPISITPIVIPPLTVAPLSDRK